MRQFVKKALSLWPICTVVLSASLAGAASPPQPVGQWRFDEDCGTAARDAAGKNNGIVHGAKWTDGTLGFQASGDYVEVPHHPTLNIAGRITIAAWIRAVNFNAPLVNKMPSGEAVLWAPGNFEFCTETGGRLALLHQTDSRGGSSKYHSEGRIAASMWQHVAVTLSEGKERTRRWPREENQ